MRGPWYSKYEQLRKVFSHKSLCFHYMYKYLTGQFSKSVLFSCLRKERLNSNGTISLSNDYVTDHFEIMKWFNLLNKNKLSKAWVFLWGGFIHMRVCLFNFQCAIFKKISDKIDTSIIFIIFGLQLFLQTALLMTFVDQYKILWFLGLFASQCVLFFTALLGGGLYLMARDLSEMA